VPPLLVPALELPARPVTLDEPAPDMAPPLPAPFAPWGLQDKASLAEARVVWLLNQAVDTRERLAAAVENNLHWYDALCEAHGVPGERHDAYWINRGTVPPYMSNFITLRDGAHAEEQLAAIRSLVEAGAGCGVKDAFHCLNLSALGLQVLFHATWIFRAANSPAPKDDGDLVWRVARTRADLEGWERTWRGTAANADAREHATIFRPSLLDNPDFRFLVGEVDGKAVATAALNRSGNAVGLSNVFSDAEEATRLFPGCVRVAHSIFPGLPLVGYERDASLVAATAAGFEAVHGLTVWIQASA
jgi:hypothetical protein